VTSGARSRGVRRRWGALALVAALAFAVGLYVASGSGGAERALVTRYVTAWANGRTRAMYGMLDAGSKRRITLARFTAELAAAAATATAERLRPGRVGEHRGSVYLVPFRIDTRTFGTLRETLELPLDIHGPVPAIAFAGTLLFPGLRPGEALQRRSELGPRGTLLADDGTPLAEGPDRTTPIPSVAGEIVGRLGPIPPEEQAMYAALGYPPDAHVGLDGLERIFQTQLAGRPGGTLLAGDRTLAKVAPEPGRTVRTTIDPAVEQAAIGAVAGSYAGMTVLDPRTGGVLALAGIAFSAAQPPGSTMKIITSVGVIQSGIATIGTTYPYATEADIGGYILKNAAGESCGGTLLNAFAVSCNSVFAPLGVQLGARRLVATAERFGFNSPPEWPGEIESTIPSAASIGGATAVGSSAIGQGMVQATTVEMADAGATIADRGRRPLPTLIKGHPARFVTVTTPEVAAAVQQMMLAVVRYGTGTSAQISGVQVAGKTGTAELADTGNQANAKQLTDGWFVGYAPAGAPTVVACALYPNAGYGAASAAPAVRQVLEAALAAHR
jgi:peptidoglycan glycosyltransferase